jgi:hypothetical protein
MGVATMLGSRRGKENDELSARWAMWSASISLPNEVGYQAHWVLLAHDAGRLL